MATRSVQALLEDIRLLGAMQFEIVEAVRALARKTIQPLDEEVKYGGILFKSGVQFSGVFAYKAHVSVEFSRGAKIDDTVGDAGGWLEGNGKGRRHLKLHRIDDITSKQLATYLQLALAAAKAGV